MDSCVLGAAKASIAQGLLLLQALQERSVKGYLGIGRAGSCLEPQSAV